MIKLGLWYFIGSVFRFFHFLLFLYSLFCISVHFLVFPCISFISCAVCRSTHLNPNVCGHRLFVDISPLCTSVWTSPPQDTASVSAGAANVFVPHTPRPPHRTNNKSSICFIQHRYTSFKESAISFNSSTFMQSLYSCCTRIFFFKESANVRRFKARDGGEVLPAALQTASLGSWFVPLGSCRASGTIRE